MHRASQPVLIALRGLDPVGVGRQAELVARGLAAAGREVHVAVTSTGGSLPGRLAAAVTVHRIGRRPVPDAAAAVRLAALAQRLRAGVLVAFGRRQAGLAEVARIAVPGLRTVVCAAVPVTGGWARRLDRRANFVIAASEGVAESCRRAGVAPGRLATVPPGIVADEGAGHGREDLAARLGLDATADWTLSVTPLVSAARLERLVWGIDQLGVVRKGMQHVLVGAGPWLRRLRRRALVQQIAERLFVLPHCELLPDLLGQVRYVWQSGATACGGVILDAMARGVPAVAVASDAAGQLVVDGETGWIVPPLPESELPRRAFGLLERPDEAARFGAAARARAAAAFPADRLVAGFAAVLDDLG